MLHRFPKWPELIVVHCFYPQLAYRHEHVVLLYQVTCNGMQATPKDSPQQQVQQRFESQAVQQDPIKGQHQSPVDDIGQPNWLWSNDERSDAVHQDVHNHPANLCRCVDNCVCLNACW